MEGKELHSGKEKGSERTNLHGYLESCTALAARSKRLCHSLARMHSFRQGQQEKKGIGLSVCAVDTDFGRGFYTTTLERQARHWAWDRYYGFLAKNPTKTGNQPVILRFRVRRYTPAAPKGVLDEGLDKLLSLAFVIGDYNYEDYWSLVQHCRQSTKSALNDHKRPPSGWYDLVSGPVAAFWEQRVVMDDSDQFSSIPMPASGC